MNTTTALTPATVTFGEDATYVSFRFHPALRVSAQMTLAEIIAENDALLNIDQIKAANLERSKQMVATTVAPEDDDDEETEADDPQDGRQHELPGVRGPNEPGYYQSISRVRWRS